MLKILENLKNQLSSDEYQDLELYIKASKFYYTDESIMPDSAFDLLQEKLLAINNDDLTTFIKNRIYKDDEMTDVSIVDETDIELQTMISLDKLKWKPNLSINENVLIVNNWFIDKIKKRFNALKYDGAALKITWNANFTEIQTILSRGGLNVTKNFKNHKDILDTKKYRCRIITGELVISKTIFNEKYSDTYENARNFVGKLLKQTNITDDVLNDLSYIHLTDGKNPLLDAVCPLTRKIIWKEILPDFSIIDTFNYGKSEYHPFMVDGVVISYMESGSRQVKNNYPLNMVAVKFKSTPAITEVIDIEYSQKKSGRLTPVAILKPVKLEGSTVGRATCYNYGFLKTMGIGIGAIVEIEKSGDIVPCVIRTITPSTKMKFPNCDYTIEDIHLIALDSTESRKFKFFNAVRSLNIDGLGEVTINLIGEVVDYDVFKLFDTNNKPFLNKALGTGDRWHKFKQIYDISSLHLSKIIFMLQFDSVGNRLSERIALLITKKSTDISNIAEKVLANLKTIGISQINETISYLKSLNIDIILPIDPKLRVDSITFEMTGNPPGMTKSEFKKKFLEINPDAIHESLTKNTKYLFCDDVNSSTGKCNKARKYNIKLVTYSDALKNKI